MHEYMTRHMVALKPFTYADWPLEPGDAFRATPDDAGYLTRCGKAKPSAALSELSPAVQVAVTVAPAAAVAVVLPQAAEPAAAPSLPAAGQTIEPVGMSVSAEPVVQVVAETAAKPAEATEAEPGPTATETDQSPADAAAPKSRRGRPSNAERDARLAAEAASTQAASES